MKGVRPARLLLPSTGHAAPSVDRRREPRPTAAASVSAAAPQVTSPLAHELDAAGTAVFEALRRHRLEVARREGIAPFIVASDRTLRDVARLRPRTLDELQLAYGIGQQKALRYGDGLLQVVASALGVTGEPRTS